VTESELKVVWKAIKRIEERQIAVERALEALLRKDEEAERASSSSDGWYS
jgi:hypothetical protein